MFCHGLRGNQGELRRLNLDSPGWGLGNLTDQLHRQIDLWFVLERIMEVPQGCFRIQIYHRIPDNELERSVGTGFWPFSADA